MNMRRVGFTLIELLVALAILGVVAGTVVAAFSTGLLVWNRAETFDAQRMNALLLLEYLEKDLRNAVPFHVSGFKGEKRQLKFGLLTRRQDPEGNSAMYVAEARYSFDADPGEIDRTITVYPSEEGTGLPADRMMTGLADVRYRYGAPLEAGKKDLVWTDTWDSEKQEGSLLPVAVAIELDLGADDGAETVARTIHLAARHFDCDEDEEEHTD